MLLPEPASRCPPPAQDPSTQRPAHRCRRIMGRRRPTREGVQSHARSSTRRREPGRVVPSRQDAVRQVIRRGPLGQRIRRRGCTIDASNEIPAVQRLHGVFGRPTAPVDGCGQKSFAVELGIAISPVGMPTLFGDVQCAGRASTAMRPSPARARHETRPRRGLPADHRFRIDTEWAPAVIRVPSRPRLEPVRDVLSGTW